MNNKNKILSKKEQIKIIRQEEQKFNKLLVDLGVVNKHSFNKKYNNKKVKRVYKHEQR